MVFSSLVFLCLFFPIFIAIYFLIPKLSLTTLAAFSLLFYAFGEPVWVLVLLLSGIANYHFGVAIGRGRDSKKGFTGLLASLIFNLGLLVFFKYTGFILENINLFLGTGLTAPGFSLPLGISFYTFQAISYNVDIYRGDIEAQRSRLRFMGWEETEGVKWQTLSLCGR